MHCPFYLAIASFITDDGNHVWNEYIELNDRDIDINNLEEVLGAFSKNEMTPRWIKETLARPKRVTVIRNCLEGGPTVIQDWG